jgi:TniQ
LGDLAGVGAIIARWERFHLNPFPSDAELAAVAEVVGVTPDRLRQMLAPEGVKMKCEPIRLCAACYQEEPYHRLEWQYQSTGGCDRHQLRLLSKCRSCQAKFPIPALWEDGCCYRCRFRFGEMTKWQKSY